MLIVSETRLFVTTALLKNQLILVEDLQLFTRQKWED